MKRLLKDPLLYIVALFLVFPAIPFIGDFMAFGTELLTWFIFALGFNLCLRYTGLVSFGHGAFYGLGSYSAALLFLHVFGRKGLILPILTGAVVAAIFAAVLGIAIRHKRGIYFALLTVVFTQVLYTIAWKWDAVTGGEAGLKDIWRTSFLGIDMVNPLNYYYFVLVFFIISAWAIRRIANSNFGKVLQAIKRNPVRAEYLGYNTARYKFAVFTIAGFWAGLGGALYCFVTQCVFASILHWFKSGDVLIATALGGGLTSFYGPILGATVLLGGQEVISRFWTHWHLIYGLAFVAVILAFPTGLLGVLERKK